MDVSLRQLRMLRELAARGTISATAEALGYTPSAVSQQLGGLEAATGTPVLERVGRNVRLTDAGRELVHHAAVVLDRLEEAEVALQAATGAVAGRLRIATFESVVAPVLAPSLALAAARHPDLELSTTELDPDGGIAAVESGQIDIALVLDYPHAPGPRPATVDRHHLFTDRLHLVVPAGDPLADGPVPLAAVAERDLISSPRALSCGRCVVQACREAGFEPRLRHEIDNFGSVGHLVAAGLGVALLPGIALSSLPDDVRAIPLEERVERTVELVHRRASRGRPALDAMLGIFHEVVERTVDASARAA